MGGSVFKEHGLSTPRMPPAVYHFALKQIEGELSMLFRRVARCIEGPGKTDHGDLDILALPDFGKLVPSLNDISVLLNAKSYHEESNGVIAPAIPGPAEAASPQAIAKRRAPWVGHLTAQSKITPNLQNSISQLDLRICTSQQEFTWRLFAHAHGDLINIISAMIRHKGLTITDQALYLRIQDLETHNKKLARVELSRDPNQVLRYLGLDPSRFWHPFWSLDEMMTYIATCRFHNPARVNSADTTELDRANVTRTTLYPYDNDRLDKRPMFQYWFQTYLPAHINDAHGPSAHLTREQIVLLLLRPELQAKYDQQKAHHPTIIIERSQLWTNIRTRILASNSAISNPDLHNTVKASEARNPAYPCRDSPHAPPNSLLHQRLRHRHIQRRLNPHSSTHSLPPLAQRQPDEPPTRYTKDESVLRLRAQSVQCRGRQSADEHEE